MSANQPQSRGFPQRILALLRDVADRKGTATHGPWEDGAGEALQDDAEAALRWIASHTEVESNGWREALQFYADRSHFTIADEDAWDTVSGEPPNFWCDEAGTAMVEDGTVAAMALRGTPLVDDEPTSTPQGSQGSVS